MLERLIILVFLSSLGLPALRAQEQGEIEPVEIEIIKEREITVPRASRTFDQIPSRPFEAIQPPLTYEFRRFSFSAPEFKAPLRPMKLKAEDTEDARSSMIGAGFGNFGSLYGEALISSKPSDDHAYGLHFLHNSASRGPVDKENSASSSTGLNLSARKYGKNTFVGGSLGLESKRNYFYGYTSAGEVDRDTIKQTFETLRAAVEVGSSGKTKFQYKFAGGFRLLGDDYSARESEVMLNLDSRFVIDDQRSFVLQADYSVAAREDALVEAKPRNLFWVLPAYRFAPVENLDLSLGARVSFDNDTLGASKAVRVYPSIDVTYHISRSVDIGLSIDGGIEKVNLQTLARQNPWIGPNIYLNHSNRLIDVRANLRIRTGPSSSLNLGAARSTYENLFFFINSSDAAKFDMVYDDGKTGVTSASGEFVITPTRSSRFGLLAEYFGYDTDRVAEAWHRPGYKVRVTGSHTFYKKVGMGIDFIAQGGMKALDPATVATVDLDAGLDLRVRIDYHVSPKFLVFVNGYNLIGQEYPLFLYYPVRGAQVMAGASITF
jgi:hypothetical protein